MGDGLSHYSVVQYSLAGFQTAVSTSKVLLEPRNGVRSFGSFAGVTSVKNKVLKRPRVLNSSTRTINCVQTSSNGVPVENSKASPKLVQVHIGESRRSLRRLSSRRKVEERGTTDGQGISFDKSNAKGKNGLRKGAGLIKEWLWNLSTTFLLPLDYPQSVSPDYGNFVIWNICRNMFRKAHYVLGTTALLHALGVGKSTALPISATLNWVLKDGLGMGTKALISSRVAPIVDRDAKRWRVIGDSLMAVASSIEMLSPLHPASFLIFGSVSSLIRQAADAMSGPCYRVFLHSFAIDSNIGDVSSRAEAQVVLGNLLGLGLGVVGSAALAERAPQETPALFLIFTTLHILSTYKSTRRLELRTLNKSRLEYIVRMFLTDSKIPTLEEANAKESILLPNKISSASVTSTTFGAPLSSFPLTAMNPKKSLTKTLYSRQYILGFDASRREFGIMLHIDADTAPCILRAYVQVQWILRSEKYRIIAMTSDMDTASMKNLMEDSFEFVDGIWEEFLDGLKANGWESGRLLLEIGEWRYKEGKEELVLDNEQEEDARLMGNAMDK